jgi:hypothetical protein
VIGGRREVVSDSPHQRRAQKAYPKALRAIQVPEGEPRRRAASRKASDRRYGKNASMTATLPSFSGSLMGYALPRADSLPLFQTEISEVPSTTNPLCAGRERGWHHTGAGGGRKCNRRRAIGIRHRAHRAARDAGAHLERDPGLTQPLPKSPERGPDGSLDALFGYAVQDGFQDDCPIHSGSG